MFLKFGVFSSSVWKIFGVANFNKGVDFRPAYSIELGPRIG